MTATIQDRDGGVLETLTAMWASRPLPADDGTKTRVRFPWGFDTDTATPERMRSQAAHIERVNTVHYPPKDYAEILGNAILADAQIIRRLADEKEARNLEGTEK